MQPRPETFSQETIEAHLAADVAEIAYKDARLALGIVARDDLEGERVAIAQAERARERLEHAKSHYRKLVMRDAGSGIVG